MRFRFPALLITASLTVASFTTAFADRPHESFTVRTPDGLEEMKFLCDAWDKKDEMICGIKSTKFVVPDINTQTQFSGWATQLNHGNDSLRNALCKNLQLIDPKVRECKEIVGLLREACDKSDSRKLALAYAKMDSLSKVSCIILNRDETLTFSREENGSWLYKSAIGLSCIQAKKYRIKTIGDKKWKEVEKTIEYTPSASVSCQEEKFIEKSSTYRQLTDAHIAIPGQCHYIYLQ